MKMPFGVKKSRLLLLSLISACLFLTIDSCKKKRSEMSEVLYKHSHNPVFKDLNYDEFAVVFKKVLAANRARMSNPDVIINYYRQNDYEPVFVTDELWNGGIDEMISHYRKANEHGLDPQIFKPTELRALADKFITKNGISTTREAYYAIAKFEILAATSLINYSSDLQFGVIIPKKIYSRYFIKRFVPIPPP